MILRLNRIAALITLCWLTSVCGYAAAQEVINEPDFAQMLDKARRSDKTFLVRAGDGYGTEVTFEAVHVEQLTGDNYRLFGKTVPLNDNDSTRQYVDCLIKYPDPWIDGYLYPPDFTVEQSAHGSLRVRAWYSHLIEIRELPESRIQLYSEIQRKIRPFAEFFGGDSSGRLLIEVAFENGTAISGFVPVRESANLDALFDLGQSVAALPKRYVEECRAEAAVSVQKKKTFAASDTFSLGRIARKPLLSRTGFLTDTYTWMDMLGVEDIPPLIVLCKQLDAVLDDEVYSLRLIDESSTVHTLFVGDFMAVKQITPVTDDALKNRLIFLYHSMAEKTDSLNALWQDEPDGAVYITFKNSAPIYGKLIEYVPSYQFDTLLYAVIEREDGTYRVLRSITDIEAVQQVSDIFAENEKEHIEQQRQAYARQLIPEETAELALSATAGKPKFVETGENSQHYKLEIKGNTLENSQYLDSFTAGKVAFSYESLSVIEIQVECSVDDVQKSAVIQIEDFLVYDNDGSQLIHKGIAFDNALSGSIEIGEEPVQFSVVCVVQDVPQFIYVRLLDMKPSKIKLKP